ncbi:MAG TPA: TonB family protein [Pyrinomonadaceae bacterium]|nr:TonB family protein [Pyrinomonadaceae bacterium]
MFNNLIESSSHAKEFKRRGSFLLFTAATYLVLFVVTGVVSIYAYDAHLESQNTELEITFVPLREAEPEPQPVKNTMPPSSNEGRQTSQSVRTALVDSPLNPNNVPDEIGVKASNVPPARSDSVIGTHNADPPTPAGGKQVGTGTGTPVVEMVEPPPPPPAPKPEIPKVVNQSTGVIKGNAIFLPKPIYSHIARQIRLQGDVTVQILIDESGNVISAKAVSGHPTLIPETLKAARQARFKPTTLSGQPVKVSGLITYNFTLNN